MRESVVDTRMLAASPEILLPAPQDRAALWREAGSRGPAPAARRAGTLRLPAGAVADTITRLVVPLPNTDLDEAGLGRVLWELASATDLALVLVARLAGTEDELLTRRRLTTLAASLRRRRDDVVEAEVVYERTWLKALRRVCKDGDVVILPGEDPSRPGYHPGQALSDRIVRDLHYPVYLLEALPRALLDGPQPRAESALAWAALLCVLAAFGVIQGEIVVQVQGWLQTILLTATVGIELASLLLVQSRVSSWK